MSNFITELADEFGATEIKSKSKSNKKEDDNVRHVSYMENENVILEQICNATHVTHATRATDCQFVVYDKTTGQISLEHEFKTYDSEELIYKPIVDDLIKTGTVLLPSGVEPYGTTSDLAKEIKVFLKNYFELPKFYENFMPFLVMFYWAYEKFPFIPYVHFVGRTGTGKTTAMEVFGSICYKPIDASGAISMSSIFRTATVWRGTLLLDEFSSTGENYQEMISFLKSGVSNRAILRVEGDKEREVKAYMIKCPKIFTSEAPISDAGLQSRTIVIRMEKNRRPIPLYRLKKYEDDAAVLRNKLLMWRLDNLNKIDLNPIEYGYKELSGFDSRVQQVITPLYYFSDEPTRIEIKEFAKAQQEETLRERREAIDGQIFTQIMETYPFGPSIKGVTEALNKEQNIQRQYTEKRIANTVRKVLGFDIKRVGHENISTIIIEGKEDKVEELCIYYGMDLPAKASTE